MNPLVITNQKLKRRKHKHAENHDTTREGTKRRNEQRRTAGITRQQVVEWQEVRACQ